MDVTTLARKLTETPSTHPGYRDLEAQYELAMLEDGVHRRAGNQTPEEILMAPVPGGTFRYNKSLSERDNARIRKALTRQDLALHYRASPKSLRVRTQVIQELSTLIEKYVELFGRYGYAARFALHNPPAPDIFVEWSLVPMLRRARSHLLEGYWYCYLASTLRSPFSGAALGPISLVGIYAPCQMSALCIKWLDVDRSVRELIDYHDQHSTLLYEETLMGLTNTSTIRILSIFLRHAVIPVGKVFQLPAVLREVTQTTITALEFVLYTRRWLTSDEPPAITGPYDPLNAEHRSFVDDANIYESYTNTS